MNGGAVTVGVRPESWRLTTQAEGGLPVTVRLVEELGADAYVYGTSGVEGTPHDIIVRVQSRDAARKGETLYVTTGAVSGPGLNVCLTSPPTSPRS